MVGKLIGHYRIESLIGVGGMGEVYLAGRATWAQSRAQASTTQSTTDETQLSRFKNEARTASALNHPNILTVYEIGAEGNVHFIATEFIEVITFAPLRVRENKSASGAGNCRASSLGVVCGA